MQDSSRSRGPATGNASGASRRRFAYLAAALVAALLGPPSRASASDWQPVTAEELAMTSEPAAPKAPAIYLYRQVDRDDSIGREDEYRRIKVLTEEGLKYADVRIEYQTGREFVQFIEARVIHPDGRIQVFNGTIYEQTLVKARSVRMMAKTFTLPDVQVGCIIEYRWRRGLPQNLIYDSRWLLNADLFTKRASFSLVKYPMLSLMWSWPLGLPEGATTPESKRGAIRMDAHDVAAFVTEPDMPPENALKMRVDFIYSEDPSPERDPAKFWKHWGKDQYHDVNKFIDHRGAMEKAVATIVQPGDAPDVKLHKIYERVQRLRNLSYEPERTEEEAQRDNIRKNSDVDDVWTHGYGNGIHLTWLFIGLARAAGIQADPVWVAGRDQDFFQQSMMNPAQLNTNVARVRLDGQELFFDPGTALEPYGTLPWSETAVKGLCLDNKDGGTWISLPAPPATDSRVEHRATLQLTERGTAEGKLIVTYTGQEAHDRRLVERDADATSRKLYLENEIKYAVPTGIEIELTSAPDWNSSSPAMTAEFDLKVPGWATRAGSRSLLQSAMFGGAEKHAYEHATRIQPLYVAYPSQQIDDVEITLPPKLKVGNLPKGYDLDLKAAAYVNKVEDAGGKLRFHRELTVRFLFLPVKAYEPLRNFYQQVRAGDEDPVVLAAATAPVAH